VVLTGVMEELDMNAGSTSHSNTGNGIVQSSFQAQNLHQIVPCGVIIKLRILGNRGGEVRVKLSWLLRSVVGCADKCEF